MVKQLLIGGFCFVLGLSLGITWVTYSMLHLLPDTTVPIKPQNNVNVRQQPNMAETLNKERKNHHGDNSNVDKAIDYSNFKEALNEMYGNPDDNAFNDGWVLETPSDGLDGKADYPMKPIWNSSGLNSSSVSLSSPWNSKCVDSRTEEDKPQPEGNALNILVFTRYRSGSTFFSELFARNPNILYLFEPFKPHPSRKEWTKEELAKNMTEMLRGIFNCSFNNSNINYEARDQHISQEDFLYACQDFSKKAIKLIRGKNLADVISFLFNNQEKENDKNKENNKLLYLVRDPRGVISSRLMVEQKYYKINNTANFLNNSGEYVMNNARMICDDYRDNIKFLKHVLNSSFCSVLHHSLRMVRYEDVARKPIQYMDKVYSFLGLPPSKMVEKWINSLPKADKHQKDLFSTDRNSASTVERWRKYLPYSAVRSIETVCWEVMQELGYKMADNENLYSNEFHSLIDGTGVPRDICILRGASRIRCLRIWM